MRTALAHHNKTPRRKVSAAIGTIFALGSAETAHPQWRSAADPLRAKLPKLRARFDGAKDKVLTTLKFPKAHWLKILSANPL